MNDVLGLRMLIAIHDEGTVTGAAWALGCTAANVSQHLRRLERDLGQPVVERVGRGVTLTARARRLVQQSRPILQQLDDLRAQTADSLDMVLTIAAFPSALRGLLIPAIAALATQHPELAIRPKELDPATARAHVLDGRADLAIIKTWGDEPLPEEDRIHTTALGVDPIDLLVHADHPLARQASARLPDLDQQTWALTPVDDPYRRWLTAHGSISGLDISRHYEALENESLIAYVQAGLAIAAVARLGRGQLPPHVTAVPLDDTSAHRTIHLLTRATAHGTAAHAAVARTLARAAGER